MKIVVTRAVLTQPERGKLELEVAGRTRSALHRVLRQIERAG